MLFQTFSLFCKEIKQCFVISFIWSLLENVYKIFRSASMTLYNTVKTYIRKTQSKWCRFLYLPWWKRHHILLFHQSVGGASASSQSRKLWKRPETSWWINGHALDYKCWYYLFVISISHDGSIYYWCSRSIEILSYFYVIK